MYQLIKVINIICTSRITDYRRELYADTSAHQMDEFIEFLDDDSLKIMKKTNIN